MNNQTIIVNYCIAGLLVNYFQYKECKGSCVIIVQTYIVSSLLTSVPVEMFTKYIRR